MSPLSPQAPPPRATEAVDACDLQAKNLTSETLKVPNLFTDHLFDSLSRELHHPLLLTSVLFTGNVITMKEKDGSSCSRNRNESLASASTEIF